jgi:hypothetical protein
MAYTDDAVKAKLSALNDSQESIVTVAQWVMFHRYPALLLTPNIRDLLTQNALDDMPNELVKFGFKESANPLLPNVST